MPDLKYLKENRHGKNMLKLMSVLALYGLRNKYELHKMSKFSYALVHKLVNELGRFGFIYNYGKRNLKKRRKSEYKHETFLWGLSPKGLWSVLLADEEMRRKWKKIKRIYEKLLPGVLEFYDIAFHISPLREEYGIITHHNIPNASMIVQALIYRDVGNEQNIDRIYDEAVEFLKNYPHGTIIRIYWALERELDQIEKIKKRCEKLQEKLKPYIRNTPLSQKP